LHETQIELREKSYNDDTSHKVLVQGTECLIGIYKSRLAFHTLEFFTKGRRVMRLC